MKVYKEQDVTGWCMSEKYDGVNAHFNGTCLITRNCNEIHAPQWFLDRLPSVGATGELWIDRGKFQDVVSVVRKAAPVDSEWERVCFMCFSLEGIFCRCNPSFQPVGLVPCESYDHMIHFYENVLAEGGEGIVLIDTQGTAWKKKPVWTDECEVINYKTGKGKFADGIAGAVWVAWKGQAFKLALPTAELRKNPPAIGSTVTFQYRGLTNKGMPRFPTYLVERNYE